MRLIAVSKTFPAEQVRAAAAAGLVDFGENRVQEALPKIEAVADRRLEWHLVGALQSNKARRAAAAFAAGEIEDEDAVPSLRDLLEDESLDVVLTAVAALGEIGGPLALEALAAASTHPEAEVRDAARAVSERTAILADPLGMTGMQY